MSTKQSDALRPKPADALVVLAVVLLALVLGFSTWMGQSDRNLTAIISVDGQVQETILLSRLTDSETRQITANGYTLSLLLSPDGAEIEDSTCPTQDCVHTGHITRPGQSIVCLPAKVSVVLKGAGESAVDVVLG